MSATLWSAKQQSWNVRQIGGLRMSCARFPPMDSPPPGYITHITVDRISGVGPWAARR